MFSAVISEECGEPQLKRMVQCAERNEIVDLISFRCFEIGKRGPCSPGELFVLNRDSDVSVYKDVVIMSKLSPHS